MKPPPALQPEPSDAPRTRGWLTWLLLIIGIGAWLTIGRAIQNFPDQVPPLMTAGATALLLLVPTVRRVALDGLRMGVLRSVKDLEAQLAVVEAEASTGMSA